MINCSKPSRLTHDQRSLSPETSPEISPETNPETSPEISPETNPETSPETSPGARKAQGRGRKALREALAGDMRLHIFDGSDGCRAKEGAGSVFMQRKAGGFW